MLRSNCVRKLLRLAVVLCSTAASLVAQQTTGVSGAFNTGTPMNAARDGASVAVLTDGRMLITGGTDANGIPIASTEFLGNGTSAGSLSTPRSHHASVTLKDGRVEQLNFDGYTPPYIVDAPVTCEVHIVPSAEAPTGCGEPPVPVISPAVVNALTKLTGKRYRKLPLTEI